LATTNKNFKVKNGLDVNSNATVDSSGNANVSGNITANAGYVSADTFRLDTTYAGGSAVVGEFSWDPDFETARLLLDGVNLQIGQEHVIRVKNASGSVAIPDRTLVMFAGSAGDTVTVSPAISSNIATYPSDYMLGITTEEITADGFGFVTQFGFINNVNTTAWTAGTLLYADPATAGGFVTSLPAAPSWRKPIAAVTRQHATTGRIFVRAVPGEELKELDDVQITSPANNQVLTYSSGIWINANATGAGGAGNTFETISANGTSVVADSSTDTLTITPGDGLSITGNATSDTITFTPNIAGASANGIVTTGTQTLAGNKTFSGNVTIDSNTQLGLAEKQIESDVGVTGSSSTGGYVYANNTHYINVASSNYFANITPQRVYPTGWTQEDFGSGGTLTANTVTVTGIWTGAAEGDIVVIFASTENAAYPTTSSSGWSSQNSGSTTYAATLFWKRMGATPDTSMVLTFTGSTTPSSYVAKRFRPTGITPSLSTAVVTVQTSAWTVGTTTTPNPAAISTVYPNAVAVTAISVENTNSGGTATVVPTGYSNSASGLQERYSYLSSTSASYSAMSWKTTPIASAGTSEDASAWTISAGTGGGTPTWSATTFLIQAYVDPTITLINTSFLSSGSFNSSTYVLHINNTSASTLSWSGATFAWQGGTAPTLSSGNNIVILETIDGTTFRGAALTSYA
jgi:hypothetical protein